MRNGEQRTRARPGLSRERILAEAARIFNRLGYHGATLDDVARALGVTKAALYYYVANKEELLFQCCKVPIAIGLEGIRRAQAEAAAPDEQLRRALAAYIEGITDQLRGSVVILEEGTLSAERYREVKAERDEYERQLRGIIARGVADGAFVPCDLRLVGFALLGAMNWIPKWYRPDGPRSGREIAEIFSSYLVRGLQAGARPPALVESTR
ncbi:MAG: TetR/AcrR family transcriptional regulator [Candidatus Rokubacteria bacterium]|nr:TetR/AcrR family transcriptional regulator [Candidatus Rokubacteria bacterium]